MAGVARGLPAAELRSGMGYSPDLFPLRFCSGIPKGANCERVSVKCELNQRRGNHSAQPISVELQERIRAALAGETSRKALSSFGVSSNTLCAALAGLPIGRGSHALILLELETREQRRDRTCVPMEASGAA